MVLKLHSTAGNTARLLATTLGLRAPLPFRRGPDLSGMAAVGDYRVGLPLLLFLRDTFPTRMTRRSPKKSNRSKGAFFELPTELKSQRRQIGEFLSGAGKPPELPNGGVVVTQVHPTVLREYWRREMAAIHRCRKFWADQKQSRESEQQ